MIIIGGGITGAGILRESARLGLSVLLIEQNDFAWGTSSRSSKLVHGGLRYLKEGKFGLTRASVHEREQLLKDGPGLVEPLDFLLANYEDDKAGRLTYGMGLTIYDLLALRWSHRYYSQQDFRLMAGQITQQGLEGGYRYGDAQTDDARLVLRVLREAVADGATAINYVRATSLIKDEDGQVIGVEIIDQETNDTYEAHATMIINATGAWADKLRGQMGKAKRIRPLRGSHLIIPSWRLPVAQAISFAHPMDQRPVFLFPWEGVTLVGTTDVDYEGALNNEPGITPDEVSYLLAAVQARYPLVNIGLDDIVSTFAGVRPVLDSGKENPSEESRDHIIWEEDGLLTVTGGKLTTYRLVAYEVMKKAARHFDDLPEIDKDAPMLNPMDVALEYSAALDERKLRSLAGRYGRDTQSLINHAPEEELTTIPGTSILWAEARWCALDEGVIHLDDLMLRRLRLGLLLPHGAKAALPGIRTICTEELGWDANRWRQEEERYLTLYNCCYSLPDRMLIPPWITEEEEFSAPEAARPIQIGQSRAEFNNKIGLSILIACVSLVTFTALWMWRIKKGLGKIPPRGNSPTTENGNQMPSPDLL